jgi:hypothetical protein
MIPFLPAVVAPRPLARAVVTFSSASDLPEQVASLRSLLRHVGQPAKITIVSDGSHSPEQRDLLAAVNRVVEVIAWHDYAAAGVPARVWRYSAVHPMGKKLTALMSLPEVPTLYADSDVLFFDGARSAGELHSCLPYYLPDLPGGLHPRLPTGYAPPANAGFFLTSGALPLREVACAHMPSKATSADQYVEQSLVHLALHRAGARALPTTRYVLRVDDHFHYREACQPAQTVLRHYIGMVRYKFWLAVARTSFTPAGDPRWGR